MIRIQEYDKQYYGQVVQHVIDIQNNEFNLGLTLAHHHDLQDMEQAYEKSGGKFWIAINENDEVIGTIALFNLGNGRGDLRRMFVKSEYRGKGKGISHKLLEILLDWAAQNGYKKIYLETISVFKAAMKFYVNNGFQRIDKSELPSNFPVVHVAEFFFVRELGKKRN
ncbi:MAG: GNAT family N-acetyltransferase [Flavobacteriales bacterium]